jgi:hypothetical protein
MLHTPQMPVDVLQVAGGVQTTAVPAQTPLVHTSLVVQARPSLQAVPLVAIGLVHTPVDVLQVPAVWH